MKIKLADYWMGRDAQYPLAMTPEIERNALRLLEVINPLIERALAAGVKIPANSRGTLVRSGWRPPAVNAATPKASPTSLHMVGRAIDIEGQALVRWLQANPSIAQAAGVWCEHPDATPTWSHLQDKPPGSGNRFFRP